MSSTIVRSAATLYVVLFLVTATALHAVAATVDFDDLSLPAEGYWNGPAAGATDKPDPWGGELPVKVGTFTNGGLTFSNEYNLNYGSWAGFAYSRVTDNTTPGYENQFSAYTGSGRGPGDDVYGVAFGYNSNSNPQTADDVADLPFIELPPGAQIQSAYVTNTTYAALVMKDGNSYAKAFGGPEGTDPDWFKLVVRGVDAGGDLLPQAVEFYLGDYRTDDKIIVNTWKFLDLSPLADARRLYFNVFSTDAGIDGMNTPGTFAIDDIAYLLVPEPASWLLLAAGIVALAARRRRIR